MSSLPALRTDLNFTPHVERGVLWYAVEEPLSGRFLRLGQHEYRLAVLLDGVRTAEQVLAAANQSQPDRLASANDLKELLTWLQRGGFLDVSRNESSASQGPTSSRVNWDPLCAKFPLLSGPTVEWMAGKLQPLISVYSAAGVLILAIVALVMIAQQWDSFFETSAKLFVPEGRAWWIVAWILLKVVHEFGHAVFALQAGSQIRSAGISFIFFAPVPFVDVSDLWRVPSRWHRILCSAGGMFMEIVTSALIIIVAFSFDHQTFRYFACAVATMGTVNTIAFNANPFIRFDGYFILADFLQRANLWADGQRAVRQFTQRVLHPWKPVAGPWNIWMLGYGIVCNIYRFAMLIGVAIWALVVWRELGVLLIAWAVGNWFVLPMWKQWRSRVLQNALTPTANVHPITAYLQWLWRVSLFAGLTALFVWMPSPIQPSVPGLVVVREPTTVRAEVEGFLSQVLVTANERVSKGQLLAEFENPELRRDVASKSIELETSQAVIQAKRARGDIADLQAEEAKLTSLAEELRDLTNNLEKLKVRAPVDGYVIDCNIYRSTGQFFTPGSALVMLGNPRDLEIKLSANQRDQQQLRQWIDKPVNVAGLNQCSTAVVERVEQIGSNFLDEPALAACFGGPITVAASGVSDPADNEKNIPLSEPRFDVRVRLQQPIGAVPGQLAFVKLPNSRSSCWDLFHHWLARQWATAEQTAE